MVRKHDFKKVGLKSKIDDNSQFPSSLLSQLTAKMIPLIRSEFYV